MKLATISSKDIVSTKTMRLDAELNIAVNELKNRAMELEKILAKDMVIERLSALKINDLFFLKPLTTGKACSNEDLIKAIKEYPYIAYAIIERNLAKIEFEANAEAVKTETYKEAVKKLKL